MKKAFITGVTGQDGSYLSELLLSKDYVVYGLNRLKSVQNLSNLENCLSNPNFHLVSGDLSDEQRLVDILNEIQPDEIYNLAAQSHVGHSFTQPITTCDVNAMGCLRLLTAMSKACPSARFYQASTSELFGDRPQGEWQNELTPFNPRSPYAVAKLFAHHMTKNFRERGFHCSSGILFNHESERRGEEFVTRKVTKHVALYLKNNGIIKPLELGNLNSRRDWGYAPDYVKAMYEMLQQDNPDDYVIASGFTRTISNLVKVAFYDIGIEIEWIGQDLDQVGFNQKTGEILVKVNPKFYRPTEVSYLVGDSYKAENTFGFELETSFNTMINKMITHDLKLLNNLK